jgi:2-methylcitrate dehydratase PrpD
MGETERLAEFSARWSIDDCPSPVLAQAKRCVMEMVGCALGGTGTPLTQAAARSTRRQAESGCATVLGLRMRAAPDRAAFLNAISANALDYDGGIVRQGHYGPTVVGSALAVGEMVKASGRQILESVIIGYEVVSRVGMALRASPERRQLVSGYGPYQGFGSVAAAGRLLALEPDRMIHAFGIYGAFAPVPSTKQCNWDNRPLSWTKDMVAWPSMAGINAALLAESEFLGPRTIFEGEKGFFRMAGSDRCDRQLLVAGLGEDFHIQRLYFKPYPCCRWSHAALEAVERILQRRGWADCDVAEVRVGVASEVAEDLSDHAPHNLVDAAFSLPYGLALVLLGVAPGPGWYAPGLLDSLRVRAAMKKIVVHVDRDMESLFTENALVGADVQVRGADGSSESERIERAYGDDTRPMSDSDLESKFRGLAAGVVAEERAESAIGMIGTLEHLDRASTLTALLAG